ncbi:insulinase family protein [Veillonella caviae]|uniref:insulinase family protein n=1 Tax=Veillonella caviae TaxID=248316 RepID=UPI0023F8A4C3|nr:insulinase family protein [Veillonella caviae]MCI7694443.1 insulinase family protein [Veillonella caviae]MDD7291089.1 insulinase family protein [Veillonella caviae]MDY5254453.1 insulinase family protein [Veillonella caviae]MDY5787385.1 insulinase family protein [Veillonella caviae]
MELNKIYSGFRLNRIERIEEINGTAYEMKHEKSGARLIYIDSPDSNKVFNIAFRTTPQDSTGVAHIMEHSVLCGSRKFPLKEPFVELVKGSLNTFLNAMTYPDKTMYPVASKNDKDFHNLMDVYLDAVFYPRAANDPEILMQEGWHYELENVDDELTYKGVVFNEMKGVYSSPDSILERELMHELFPDTTYGVDSGGNPEVIPELTYEGFQEFYRTHYHPSNSYIFLYGTMDIEEQLRFINDEYLSYFDAIEVDTEVTLQAPFNEGKIITYPYSIGSDESIDNRTLHALAYVLPAVTPEQSLAFEVLTHALLTSPAAPLKQVLVKAGIGSDVSGYYLDSIRQPMWAVHASGSNMDKQMELQSIVEATLTKLCEEGIDKELLEASLNSIEFALRENDFGGRPIGLAYVIRMMDNWLYGNDPLELLHYEEGLKNIRKGLHGTYFEDLIRHSILENNHKALVSMYPECGLQEKKDRDVKEQLANIKSSMSQDELEAIVEQTKRLKIRQETPDSEEALASIPLLELSDLNPYIEEVERRESTIGATKVHFVPTFTKGINYVAYYFHLDGLTEEELFYADILSDIIGRIDTTRPYADVAKDINLNLGGLSSDITAIAKDGKRDEFTPLMIVRSKALHAKLPDLCRIVNDVIHYADYSDVNRLTELVQENKAIWDNEAFRRGNTIVSQRVMAQVSKVGKFRDAGNLGYYQKISELATNPAALPLLPDKLSDVARKIFRANNVEIMFVGEDGELAVFTELMTPLLSEWSTESLPRNVLQLTNTFGNDGIATAGKVQYVAQGGNFIDHGFKHVGPMSVLETILRYEYLWIRIRVQGGAYGAFANFFDDGNMIFCSYRDPNLVETYNVYKELPEYLRSFTLSDREMRKYIIGTMSGLDLPMTPALRGPRAMGIYFSGANIADKVEFRKQVIACKPEDIVALADVVESVLKDNHICSMGNETKIKESNLFDNIVSLG